MHSKCWFPLKCFRIFKIPCILKILLCESPKYVFEETKNGLKTFFKNFPLLRLFQRFLETFGNSEFYQAKKIIERCLTINFFQCTSCSQLVIHPEQRFNFFSDYSQTVSCPHCGVQDFHFTKALERTFLSREDITRLNARGGDRSSQLSWARITANA